MGILGLDARKPVLGVCEQRRLIPACASAHTDLRLCYSLILNASYLNFQQVKFQLIASLCS